MTRIGGNVPGNVFFPPPPEPKGPPFLFLDRLPDELPPPSHTPPTTVDLLKLLLPEGMDLSRLPKAHPLTEYAAKLWLEVTLKAITSGGKYTTPPRMV